MISFRHPAFAKLLPKIDRALKEEREVEEYLSAHADEVAAGDWGAISAVSLGVHNVYNGIEDILLSLSNDVDGYVPQGPALHQDLLDQMAADVAEIRSAVLDQGLYRSLVELKGFRHLVRHRYGFDLLPGKVLENAKLMKSALPAFVDAVVALERSLVEEGTTEKDGGGRGSASG